MITFCGKKYAKNDSEFVESLFQQGGTCNGFYRYIKHGIKLYNHQNNLKAFLVIRHDRKEYFAVSASTHHEKDWFQYGISETTEKWLGIDTLSPFNQTKAIQCITES